jgi:MscS family membrane protein
MKIRKPLLFVLILFGFRFSIVYLPLGEKIFIVLKAILNALIIWQLSIMIWQVVRIFLRIWKDKAISKGASSLDDLMPLIYDASKIFLFSVSSLLVISQFGIEIGPFVASLGIAGFAIGFAVKDVLGNVFGGVSLILDRTFRLGDKVEIEGYELGYVEEVGIRTTKIRTFDGELIVIPNGILVNKAFKNYGLPNASIRACVNFSVAYGNDVNKVKEIVLEVIETIPSALNDPPPIVEFLEMGDTSLNFVAKFWVSNFKEQYDNRLVAIEKIYNALNKAGIEIPFPTYTVYLKKN